MKHNYRFTIRYDGTRYHGWESKKEVDTIEGKLEAVFSKMTGQPVKINGAGRTDAGVHALGMVASGMLDTEKSPKEIKAYANHYLPDDICILDVAVCPERFHARLNATGKTYRYTCYVGDEKPVFDRAYTWVLPEWVTRGTRETKSGHAGDAADVQTACRIPDITAMKKAVSYLIGTHDFKSFCGNNKMKKSTVRTIYGISIDCANGYLTMTFDGNGFLQNMVRILVGTLLEVGYGRIAPEEIEQIVAARDRQQAGPTAPPHGLTLIEVHYIEKTD